MCGEAADGPRDSVEKEKKKPTSSLFLRAGVFVENDNENMVFIKRITISDKMIA